MTCRYAPSGKNAGSAGRIEPVRIPDQSARISAWNAGLAPEGSAFVWGNEPGSRGGFGARLTAAAVVELRAGVVDVLVAVVEVRVGVVAIRVAVVDVLGGGEGAGVVARRLDPPQPDRDKQAVTPTIVRWKVRTQVNMA